MSSYVKRAMQHDEKVLYAAQLHWIIYQSGIIATILGAALGHFAPPLIQDFVGGEVGKVFATPIKYFSIGIIFFGALQLIFSFIRQISTELVITDQRVIAKHGLIATTSYELMMTKVEGATIDQSVLGRILDYGTLMVKGTGGGISPIDHVAHPFLFHSFLMDAVHAAHEPDKTNKHHD